MWHRGLSTCSAFRAVYGFRVEGYTVDEINPA